MSKFFLEYTYQKTNKDKNCPSLNEGIDLGYKEVGSPYECKTIDLSKNSLTFKISSPFKEDENNPNYPKNCYELNGLLYWNNHENGSDEAGASKICRTQRK